MIGFGSSMCISGIEVEVYGQYVVGMGFCQMGMNLMHIGYGLFRRISFSDWNFTWFLDIL